MAEMHSAVKNTNAAEGRIGGYLVVWGDRKMRDLQGEYFSKETDFALEWYEARPVLYHHGLDGQMKAAVIGRIDSLSVDEIGIWAEAQLDMHKRYVQAVQRLVEKGILHWSSGSLGHLVEVEADGHIKRWPLVEGSLTPTPAEPRRTDVQSIKSAYEALGIALIPNASPSERRETNKSLLNSQGEAINAEEMEGMKMQPIKQLPVSQEDANPRMVVSSEFDNVDALDMLHGYMLLRASKGFQGVSERYANALSQKIGKTGLLPIKADELSYSTQTGFGDEWVPDLWSAQIWQKARQENTVLPLFRSIEMASNPFELPIEDRVTP
jgi:hypothetical protein